MTTLPQKELLRPDEVARYFDVHKSTVYRWIDEGKLQAVKIGDKIIRIPLKSMKKMPKPT
jgi:excisionase family DNA binding protein